MNNVLFVLIIFSSLVSCINASKQSNRRLKQHSFHRSHKSINKTKQDTPTKITAKRGKMSNLKEWKELLNKGSEIRIHLALNINTPKEILKELADCKEDFQNQDYECLDIKRSISLNPKIPYETIKKLLNHTDDSIRHNLALNLQTDSESLKILSNDKDYWIRSAVAENKNTPEEILKKLSNDEDYRVRVNLAQNLHTSVELLRKLSKDKKFTVIKYIARNPNTPKEILKEFYECKNFEDYQCQDIKTDIALNPQIPKDIFIKLAECDFGEYPCQKIKVNLSSNPSASAEDLKKFLKESRGTLSEKDIKRSISLNPELPHNLAEELLKNKDHEFVSNLAGNTNLSQELFEKLSKTNDFLTLMKLCSNRKIGGNILLEIYERNQKSPAFNFLVNAFISNPDTPDSIMEKIIQNYGKDKKIKEKLLQRNNLSLHLLNIMAK